jgi:hypothetical protein
MRGAQRHKFIIASHHSPGANAMIATFFQPCSPIFGNKIGVFSKTNEIVFFSYVAAFSVILWPNFFRHLVIVQFYNTDPSLACWKKLWDRLPTYLLACT